MSKTNFTQEFKEEAVKQVLDRGYTVPDVAKRLGVSAQSLYKWLKAYGKLDCPVIVVRQYGINVDVDGEDLRQ